MRSERAGGCAPLILASKSRDLSPAATPLKAKAFSSTASSQGSGGACELGVRGRAPGTGVFSLAQPPPSPAFWKEQIVSREQKSQ